MNHKTLEANAASKWQKHRQQGGCHPEVPCVQPSHKTSPGSTRRPLASQTRAAGVQLPRSSVQSLTRTRKAHSAPSEGAPPRSTVSFKRRRQAPEQRRKRVIREAPETAIWSEILHSRLGRATIYSGDVSWNHQQQPGNSSRGLC